MKWFPFIILAVAATVCQTVLGPRMEIRSIRPDWMFILVVHYALWAPWPEAGLAGWVLGLMLGIESLDEPVGLHAFCYGAAAWGIFRCRHAVFRQHPATQFVLTLAFTFGVQLAASIYRVWKLPASPGAGEFLTSAFLTAVYTAALTPLLYWGLSRLGRWTGLRSGQRMSRYQ